MSEVIKYNEAEMLEQIAYSLKTESKTDLDVFIMKAFNKCCDDINAYINGKCTSIAKLYEILENTNKNTSCRIKNTLSYYKIKYMEQLIGITTVDLLKMPNLGHKCIKNLEDAWIEMGHKVILTDKYSVICDKIYEFVW